MRPGGALSLSRPDMHLLLACHTRTLRTPPARRTTTRRTTRLVDLDVPLARLLPLLELLLEVEALLLAHTLQHLGDARHHALEAAEVHVRALVHALEDLVGVLLDLVLDVHLAAVDVGLLAGEGVVELEVVGVLLEHLLPLVVVQERVRVGDAEEEPREALVRLAEGGLLDKQTADERAVRCDASAGGDHDE